MSLCVLLADIYYLALVALVVTHQVKQTRDRRVY